MALKKHHKWMIGGFSTFLIAVIIANSLFIYFLYGQLQSSYNDLQDEIAQYQAQTQSKINELTQNVVDQQTELQSLGSQIGDIDSEFSQLKASVDSDFSGIIENILQSVVTVRTNVGQGTGFLIDEDGYVVTNSHVISGATSVYVITYEQKLINAQFIGYDENLDIALLKIPGSYTPVKLANSNKIQIGEKVVAIGNPLGLQFSVSEGIISAIHREGPNGLGAYVQTDAALNPGNSGGPLIDKQGEVVGINNFKIGGGESLGFALESNYIATAINEISQQYLNETLV